jgi:hypothetical protein
MTDYAAEVRDALHKCHGLRAWELALESGREELVRHVRGVTGWLSIHDSPPKGGWQDPQAYSTHHQLRLCGVAVATLTIDHRAQNVYTGPVSSWHTTRLRISGATCKALARHIEGACVDWLGKPDAPKGRPRWTLTTDAPAPEFYPLCTKPRPIGDFYDRAFPGGDLPVLNVEGVPDASGAVPRHVAPDPGNE